VGVIDEMPCSVRLLKTTQRSVDFFDFNTFERLVAAARGIDATTDLLVLLAGLARVAGR
jgi:hypothetical protein